MSHKPISPPLTPPGVTVQDGNVVLGENKNTANAAKQLFSLPPHSDDVLGLTRDVMADDGRV